MNKIYDTLCHLQQDFIGLKSINYKEGEDKSYQRTLFLERVIDRIYPEKDAKQLKAKLHGERVILIVDEAAEQRNYLYDIDMKLHVIKTMLEEYEVFGLDDFKPIKETIETQAGVKAGLFSFGRKKTTEKRK